MHAIVAMISGINDGLSVAISLPACRNHGLWALVLCRSLHVQLIGVCYMYSSDAVHPSFFIVDGHPPSIPFLTYPLLCFM